MTITVEATDIHDARHQLGLTERTASIRIRWNSGDYGRKPTVGCIVDATDTPNQRVPLAFDSAGRAVRYIAKILKAHDKYVKSEIAKVAKEAKAAKKK